MALVLEDGDVCNSWEDIEENTALLEKQLARLKVNKNPEDPQGLSRRGQQQNSGPITIDSTREESLRTQYVPPEPKLKILARPKGNRSHQPATNNTAKSGKPAPAKTLQQREEEYAAARMRILGDVRFEAEEAQAEMESNLSPAEILKLKVAEAIRGDNGSATAANNKRPPNKSPVQNGGAVAFSGNNVEQQVDPQQANPAQNGQQEQPRRRNKRSREKVKTVNPEPQRDFPVPKTESDRIIRHPRGPDGSTGFINTFRS